MASTAMENIKVRGGRASGDAPIISPLALLLQHALRATGLQGASRRNSRQMV